MKELLTSLLIAVITAAVPVLTTYAVSFIRKASESVSAKTDNIILKDVVSEVSNAVCNAVTAVNQTYVDELKKSGEFTAEAQKEAAQRALDACIAALTSETQEWLDNEYDDMTEYLKNLIEAEVRNQKLGISTLETVS